MCGLRRNLKYCFCFVLAGWFVLSGCGKVREDEAQRAYNSVSLQEADVLLNGPVKDTGSKDVKSASLKEPVQTAQAPVSLDHPGDEMVQTALKKLGFYHGKIDGKLGRKSKKAIKEFQSANKLAADGNVGPKTWGLLKKALEDQPRSQETIAHS